jgi:hypothetical protein
MKVDRDAVVFSSCAKWYTLEESGRKPNTVRWLDAGEFDNLLVQKPSRIRIIDSDHKRSFSRTLSWWGTLDDCLGMYLVMFCWRGA